MSKNLRGGQWSNQFTRQFMLGLLLTLAIAFFSVYLLQASLNCVDDNGCFKSHCDLAMFSRDYITIIRESNNKNTLCRKAV